MGLPIITTSGMISLGLDVTATSMTLIDYGINRGDNRGLSLLYQFGRLSIGGGFGHAIDKVTRGVKIFSPIYSPLIF